MKKFIYLVLFFCFFSKASGYVNDYDFEKDGFYYEITSVEERTCRIVSTLDSIVKHYKEIKIPNKLDFLGNTFSVNEIAYGAFEDISNVNTIILPEGITKIDCSFRHADSLTYIYLPQSLKTIGSSFLYDANQLKEITFPDSLEEIPSYTLYESRNLEKIIFPKHLKKIGVYAFNSSYKVRELNFPEELVSVGNGSFSLSYLEHIYVPKKLNINNLLTGYSSFDNLQTIKVSPDNPFYSDENGVLYNKTKTALIRLPAMQTGNFYVPETVDSIYEYACQSSHVRNIQVPNSTTYIGRYAFYKAMIEEIDIKASVDTIRNGTFYLYGYGNSSKVKLPKGIKNINDNAFSNVSDIYIDGEIAPTITSYSFNTYSALNIHVTRDALNNFKQAEYWNMLDIIGDYDPFIYDNSVIDFIAKRNDIGYFTFSKSSNADECLGIYNQTHDICSIFSKKMVENDSRKSWYYLEWGLYDESKQRVYDIIPEKKYYVFAKNNAFTNGLYLKEGPASVASVYNIDEASVVTFKAKTDSTWIICVENNPLVGVDKMNSVVIGNYAVNENGWEYYDYGDSVLICGLQKYYPETIIPAFINGKRVCGFRNYCFYNNFSSRSLEFPDNLFVNIPEKAFYHTTIGQVKIGNGVKRIGNEAFYNSNVREIIISEGLEHLNYEAFEWNPIEEFNIPSTLYDIEYPEYMGTWGQQSYGNNFKNINVHPNNNTYASIDGILYTKDLKKILSCPVANETLDLTVPNAVETIGSYSFRDVKKIETLHLSHNTKEIGYRAFSGASIKDIYCPVVPAPKFGSNAISHVNLHVPIGYSHEYADISALDPCNIVDDIFVNIERIDIPDTLFVCLFDSVDFKDIVYPSFSTNKQLVWESSAPTVVSVDNGTLNTFQLGMCIVTAKSTDNSGTSKEMVVKVIPKLISSIEIKEQSTINIGDSASLGIVIKPSNATYKTLKWYSDNESIATVDSLGTVYTHAVGVVNITCATTDGSEITKTCKITVLPIDEDIISGSCGDNVTWTLDKKLGLLKIEGTGELTDYSKGGAPWIPYQKFIQRIQILDGVTSIGNWAFHTCQEFTTITLPESITRIGEWAFCECLSLSSITLPINTRWIDENAFAGCVKLPSIFIPKNVEYIGIGTFNSCLNLASISVDENNANYASEDGVLFNKSMNRLDVFPANNKITTYVIPESVTSIGDEAFYNCSALTSITIPNSVTSIGNFAFYNCSRLTSVILPENISNLGDNTFAYCKNLTDITCPSTTPPSISSNTFTTYGFLHVVMGYGDVYRKSNFWKNFTIVEDIIPDFACGTLGDSLTWTFNANTGLLCIEGCGRFEDFQKTPAPWHPFHKLINNIQISEGIENIGDFAFYDCIELTNVTLPISVIEIGEGAFLGCEKLSQLELPEKMTNIGASAFSGCSSLTNIVIPSSINYIESYAFSDCPALTVIFAGKLPIIKSFAFSEKYSKFDFSVKNIIVPSCYYRDYAELTYSENTKLYPAGDILFEETPSREEIQERLSHVDKSNLTSITFVCDNLCEEHLTIDVISELNPNCLIYVSGSCSMTGSNLVKVNGGKDYSCRKLSLTDGYPFGCPSIDCQEVEYVHNPSVWANGKSGWETLCLPFSPTSIRASESGYLSPIVLGGNGNFWLRKYVGSSNTSVFFTSTADGVIEANTPYLIAFPGQTMGAGHLEGETITFSASNVTIDAPADPEPITKNEFVFKSTYNTTPDSKSGYELNAEGSSFVQSATVGTKPFQAYFTNDELAAGSSVKSLRIDFGTFNDETGIFEVEEGSGMQTGTAGTFYDLSGRRIGQGATQQHKGIYISNGRKIVKL